MFLSLVRLVYFVHVAFWEPKYRLGFDPLSVCSVSVCLEDKTETNPYLVVENKQCRRFSDFGFSSRDKF
jgi:hypothetical protein